MVCVWKVNAIATWLRATCPLLKMGASFWRIASRLADVASSMPVNWDLPFGSASGFENSRIFATVPGTSALPVLSCTSVVITTA